LLRHAVATAGVGAEDVTAAARMEASDTAGVAAAGEAMVAAAEAAVALPDRLEVPGAATQPSATAVSRAVTAVDDSTLSGAVSVSSVPAATAAAKRLWWSATRR
jgi:hypothetical protein